MNNINLERMASLCRSYLLYYEHQSQINKTKDILSKLLRELSMNDICNVKNPKQDECWCDLFMNHEGNHKSYVYELEWGDEPPTLGISVSEEINTTDKFGG